MGLEERNVELGRVAIELRFLDQGQAFQVLNEARRQQSSLLDVAMAWNFLDSAACQAIERRLESSAGIRRVSSHSDAVQLPQIGQLIDGYTIESLLGRGGMGAVFKANKLGLGGENQVFAMKFILTREETALARFEREAHAVAAVDRHPNIVSIKSYATWNGCPYLVFDYVEGQNLDQVMQAKKHTLREATRIVELIAKALQHIHEKDVLHRDLKPANVLIRDKDGQVFLTDFGLARRDEQSSLTQSQDMLGTPHYMSPEQAGSEHEAVGPGTDIWALGVIYYELLTGAKPFDGGTGMELVTKILFTEPRRPGALNKALPSTVDAVILKALRKAPAQRYLEGQEFAEECRRILMGESVLASRALPFSGIANKVTRILGWKGVLAIVVSISLIVAATGFWLQARTRDIEKKELEQRIAGKIGSLGSSGLGDSKGFLAERLLTQLEMDRLPKPNRRKFDSLLERIYELRGLDKESRDKDLGESFFEYISKKNWRQWNSMAAVYEALGTKKDYQPEALPKAWDAWLSGARALKDNDNSRAANRFEVAAASEGDLGYLGQFGLGLCHYCKRDWGSALALFSKLERRESIEDAYFQRIVVSMRKQSFIEYKIEQLFRGDLARSELKRLQEQLNGAKFSTSEWEAFNRRLSDSFTALVAEKLSASVLIYRRIDASASVVSLLRCPKPPLALHRELAKRARREGKLAKALYHQLEMQKLDPKNTEGVLRNEDLAKMVIDAGIVKNDLEEAYLITLEVSRAGCYLPYLRDGWREILDEKGVLDREVKKAPMDPYPRFWRAMTSILKKGVYKQRLEDASFVIGHPLTREHFKALMLERRARLWRESAIELHGFKGKMLADAYLKSRQDLERAISLKHPCPDEVYREFCLLDESLPDELRTEKVRLRWLRFAKLWLEAIDDRYDRSAKGTLGEGRDPEGPRLIMSLGNRGRLRSNAHRMLADAHLANGDFLLAVKEAEASIRMDPASSPKKLSNWAPKTLIRALLSAKREDEASKAFYRLAKQGRKKKNLKKLQKIWLEFGLEAPSLDEKSDD
ncbi:MAG: serine/threonine-protein kinase [Planctomycetota bacterium]|nr:serine/threonine-protein kinase [Planctomycetota bacterium]